MRHLRLVTLFLACIPLLAGCPGGGSTYSTTINIYGPFKQCTVITLPDFRQVSFGDRGVNVTGPSTIAVGTTVYNIDLSNCNARTETTTTNPPPAS